MFFRDLRPAALVRYTPRPQRVSRENEAQQRRKLILEKLSKARQRVEWSGEWNSYIAQYVVAPQVYLEYSNLSQAQTYWRDSCYDLSFKEINGQKYTKAEAIAWWMKWYEPERAIRMWELVPDILTDGRTRQRTNHRRTKSVPIRETREIPEAEKGRLKTILQRILP